MAILCILYMYHKDISLLGILLHTLEQACCLLGKAMLGRENHCPVDKTIFVTEHTTNFRRRHQRFKLRILGNSWNKEQRIRTIELKCVKCVKKET